MFHINALVVGVLSTLVAGSSLVLDQRFSIRSFWSTVDDNEVTWVNVVPAVIAVLAAAAPPPPTVCRRVRFARSASAPLAPAVLHRFEERCGISVLETYGMTEAASQITANPLDPMRRRPGSVGVPVGVQVRVVDEAGRPVPVGAVGKVDIKGASVSGRGWLTTGDVGWLDDDGFLWLEGRDDDAINRGGEKINPAEIERVLLTDPRVRAAIVVGRAHAVVGEEPVAFVIADVAPEERAQLAVELAERCQSSLSQFKWPVHITIAEALPAGPTGKVKRSVLRQLAVREMEDAK
jgi:acyl-CoA synthetase (AMP-forming)/AMP-acid ligase II